MGTDREGVVRVCVFGGLFPENYSHQKGSALLLLSLYQYKMITDDKNDSGTTMTKAAYRVLHQLPSCLGVPVCGGWLILCHAGFTIFLATASV